MPPPAFRRPSIPRPAPSKAQARQKLRPRRPRRWRQHRSSRPSPPSSSQNSARTHATRTSPETKDVTVAEVSAALIREVRAVTGAGMSDVKKALVEADGDKNNAIEALRKQGLAKAGKRAGERQATNG